jgi:XTP/dITP diphosphohydrolase
MKDIEARLASQNRHKLDELRNGLPGWAIELLVATDWPPEDGSTYLENARGKAHFGRLVGDPGVWMLGEDSGIECAALGGEPGLHSARWAPGADQAVALLERLAGETNRRARMVTELVAIAPGGEEFLGSGVLSGTLTTEKRGSSGFGYDPIFIPEGHEQTVAELGERWKRQNSHRARAAQSLLAAISARARPAAS